MVLIEPFNSDYSGKEGLAGQLDSGIPGLLLLKRTFYFIIFYPRSKGQYKRSLLRTTDYARFSLCVSGGP